MRKLILWCAVALVAMLATTSVASADGGEGGQAPAGSKLILNVTLKVTNDEDSGNVGYWALDRYNKTIRVWQLADGSFFAIVKYDGSWQTFAGARSPGAGITQSADGSGSMEGSYTATFTGTFTPGSQKTFGSIAASDCGGTKADVLLGSYGNGQAYSGAGCFRWLSAYFTSANGFADFAQPTWGWVYRYRNQTWNNASTGTTGDIVIGASGGHGDGEHRNDGGHRDDGGGHAHDRSERGDRDR